MEGKGTHNTETAKVDTRRFRLCFKMAGGLINFEIAGAVRGIMLERKNAGLWRYQSNMQQQVGWKEVQPQLTAPDNRHNKGAAKHCILFISKQWHVPSCRFQFFHRMAIKRYTCKCWNKKHTHMKRQEGQSWRKQLNILHGMETNSTEPNTVIWSPKGHHKETTTRRTTANTTKKYIGFSTYGQTWSAQT